MNTGNAITNTTDKKVCTDRSRMCCSPGLCEGDAAKCIQQARQGRNEPDHVNVTDARTPIGVLPKLSEQRTFASSIPPSMSTTGKRFAKRTSDKFIHRVLDARTKAVLNAVLDERSGHALDAWLRAMGPRSTGTGRG